MKNNGNLLKYLVSMLLFGLNGIVASNIALNSYEIVLFRTLIGSIFLGFLFICSKGKFNFAENKRDYLFIALSGIAMGTSWMFLYEAYDQVGVSIASLLYYSGPVIVMVFSPLMFKEKLTLPKIAGFLIVAVGIVLVNGHGDGNKMNVFGIICGFLSAVMYFFMVTLNKQSIKVSGLENTVVQLVVSFITTATFVGVKEQFAFHISRQSIIWIIILGVVNTGIGCYLYFSSIGGLAVQTVAVCGYLELLSAVVFATLLLGEKMTVPQIIGGIFVVGGALMGELFRPKQHTADVKKL